MSSPENIDDSRKAVRDQIEKKYTRPLGIRKLIREIQKDYEILCPPMI